MSGRRQNCSAKILGGWVAFVQRHSAAVILSSALVTAAVLFYSLSHFKINTDITGMISEKLPFRKSEKDFSRAFPNLSDTLVLIVDGETAELAISARDRLVREIGEKPELFGSVYVPGGGEFFEKNGLLYLSTQDLQQLSDSLAEAQPLIAFLSRDLNLRGLFSIIGMILGQAGGEMQDRRFDLLFVKMAEAFENAAGHRAYVLHWQEMMLGKKEAAQQRKQFIIVKPLIDKTLLSAGERPILTVRNMIKRAGFGPGVKVRITGDLALAYENLLAVRDSTSIEMLVSLIFVAVIIFLGLGRSLRLMTAALITLLCGLVWTTGFALAAIGSLNLISITFAVLFIGLGIDYSIQFCLRYRELLGLEYPQESGLTTAAQGVGRSLFLSCVTTAIGFYSFLPTPYSGVAELGLISGTGMFISFFATLTVLPALLAGFPLKKKIKLVPPEESLVRVPYRYSGAIATGAVALSVASAFLLPRVYFNYNPLDLYDKSSESVSTIKELFRDSVNRPWTASVLVRSRKDADELARKLSKLTEVNMAITLSDFVPENQPEKLSIISDISLVMPPGLRYARVKRLSYDQEVKALRDLEKVVRQRLLAKNGKENPSLQRLSAAIRIFDQLLSEPSTGVPAMKMLENNLVSGLPGLFQRLGNSLEAVPVKISDLPEQLVNQYVSVDGRYRVQVFPKEDIQDAKALARFVNAVRTVAPEATDAPVIIYESGTAVISSFRQAAVSALIAITVFLLIELRNVVVTVLILIPLFVAMLLTAAASVLFSIPLNFANVIVVPLLMGVGVHTGIIFILRYQTEPPASGNMLETSTARAVLVSTLTIMISTGSLSFSAHLGISSMGKLLTICFGLTLVCTLVLLPALIEMAKNRFNLNK